MSELSTYLAAMANVKDVKIDPNSGAVTGGTGKSLLEKNGVDAGAVAEKLPADIREQVQEAAKANTEKRNQGESYVTAYRAMNGLPVKEPEPEQPIVEDTPQEQQRPVHPTQQMIPPPQQTWNEQYVTKVGQKPNEDAYMALLAKNCKRKY